MIVRWLTVFALGVAELWAAAPFGALWRMDPLMVWLVAAGGAITGGTVVVLLGDWVRRWLGLRRRQERLVARRGPLYRVWQRQGVVGWGLLAPLLIGSPLGAAFGLLLGAPARRLIIWLGIGSLLWSLVFSTLVALGKMALTGG